MRLNRLLRPRSIAVIGGGRWGANVIEQCQKIGFAGPIWPVHPTRDSLAGCRAYPDIASLPEAPDAVFIGVNRGATVDAVRALAARGAGGAVCFASGFREAEAELADGADLEGDLIAAAGDMPILGPNCYGFLNARDGAALWPDVHGMLPCPRGVAIITQSSNLSINLTMGRSGLPIAYMVTAGNQAQTGMTEIGQALLQDPAVTALGLHIEGIGDLPGFVALAKAAQEAGKPVIALKVGASAQAQAAMVSHTASLAGSDAGARALLARLGIARVATPAAFVEALKFAHVAGHLGGGRIASMSCSGGEAGIMADLGAAHGLTYPPLTPAQSDGLRTALGPKVALANPLDYHTYIWGDRSALRATFQAMMAADLDLGIVVLDYPRTDRFSSPDWDMVVDALADVDTQVPRALLATLPENMPEDVARDAIARGIVPLNGMSDALAAIAALGAVAGAKGGDVLVPRPCEGARTLPEDRAKTALAAHGLPVPDGQSAATPEVAADAARHLGGRLVLKGLGQAHKTEAGLVALDLSGPEAVADAARAMPASRFLVERMVPGALAELLVGVTRDPAHGFVLTLGAGGTKTELWADTTTCLLPADRETLREMLLSLRMAPLLTGFRGAPPADLEALLDALLAIGAYVAAQADSLLEVEVNPLLCLADGAVAADALIRLGDPV